MTDNNGPFIQQSFNGCCMIKRMKSFQNLRTGGYRMIFITNDILDADHHSMQTARFFSGPALLVQSVGSFQGLVFINMYKCIEVLSLLIRSR